MNSSARGLSGLPVIATILFPTIHELYTNAEHQLLAITPRCFYGMGFIEAPVTNS